MGGLHERRSAAHSASPGVGSQFGGARDFGDNSLLQEQMRQGADRDVDELVVQIKDTLSSMAERQVVGVEVFYEAARQQDPPPLLGKALHGAAFGMVGAAFASLGGVLTGALAGGSALAASLTTSIATVPFDIAKSRLSGALQGAITGGDGTVNERVLVGFKHAQKLAIDDAWFEVVTAFNSNTTELKTAPDGPEILASLAAAFARVRRVAEDRQFQHCLAEWTRYCGLASGRRAQDVTASTVPELPNDRRFLLDLEIEAEHPDRPVRVVSASIDGLPDALRAQIPSHRLLDLNLPMHVYGRVVGAPGAGHIAFDVGQDRQLYKHVSGGWGREFLHCVATSDSSSWGLRGAPTYRPGAGADYERTTERGAYVLLGRDLWGRMLGELGIEVGKHA